MSCAAEGSVRHCFKRHTPVGALLVLLVPMKYQTLNTVFFVRRHEAGDDRRSDSQIRSNSFNVGRSQIDGVSFHPELCSKTHSFPECLGSSCARSKSNAQTRRHTEQQQVLVKGYMMHVSCMISGSVYK